MTRPRIFRSGTADRGSLTLFTVIVVIGLFAAVGFVVDAGAKMQAAQTAEGLAQQAARAGATQVNQSQAYSRGGQFVISPAAAVAAAEAYLSQNGHTGTVTVTGNRTIQVTVTISEPAVFTQVIGISELSATETASASLVQGITGPQP